MKSLSRRRLALACGGALAFPGIAGGQSARAQRMAFLSGGTQSDSAIFFAAFLEGMRERGYRERQSLVIDQRFAEYSAERAVKLAAEIAALKPAVILASGGGIRPACQLTPPLPVVFMHSGDPVDAGFADSIPRPGRNATGVTLLALDLIAKRVEILRTLQPKLRRLAFLASPEHPGQKSELAASRAAAVQFGIDVSYHEVRTPAELQAALPKVAAEKPDGALLFSDALMVGQRKPLSEFFLRHRIPSVAGWSGFPDSGHLVSYGPERNAAWRRLSYFADRILRGARPGEISIEFPTVMELVVNRTTAKAMGLALPQEILLRANRIVDAPAG